MHTPSWPILHTISEKNPSSYLNARKVVCLYTCMYICVYIYVYIRLVYIRMSCIYSLIIIYSLTGTMWAHPIYEMADPYNCHYQRMSVLNCAISLGRERPGNCFTISGLLSIKLCHQYRVAIGGALLRFNRYDQYNNVHMRLQSSLRILMEEGIRKSGSNFSIGFPVRSPSEKVYAHSCALLPVSRCHNLGFRP